MLRCFTPQLSPGQPSADNPHRHHWLTPKPPKRRPDLYDSRWNRLPKVCLNTLIMSWMLLMATSTVSIVLSPLDNSLARKFTLNPSKSFIEIGRASKTASKGLAAAKDNAWFDSPIMSRSHAELVVVTDPVRVSCLGFMAKATMTHVLDSPST